MTESGPDSYKTGSLFGGKYNLVRRLESGGMGTVWIAHHTDLDTHVAIKVVKDGLLVKEYAERLLKEARMVARLRHPAIVQVFDFGRAEHGEPYIVMELLHGASLGEHLQRRGRISAAEAVQLLLPVADALATAHDAGIVHRDLKPDNIYVAVQANRTQPKVLDFGIARADVGTGRHLTTAGALLGSPGYMSPEQARGQTHVDARTDVWAFCIVLYEAMTGTAAFHGENYNAVLRAIIENDPTPTHELAAGDPVLWSILERGLAKDLDWRWSSMRELGTALAQWLLNQGVTEDVTRASLQATWLEGVGRDETRFSIPGVARSTTDAPPSGSAEAPGLQVVSFTPAPTPRHSTPTLGLAPVLTTGGHGAVSVASEVTKVSRRRTGLAVGAAVVVTGVLVWGTARKMDATPSPSAIAPSSAVVESPRSAASLPTTVVDRRSPEASSATAPPSPSATPSATTRKARAPKKAASDEAPRRRTPSNASTTQRDKPAEPADARFRPRSL